MRPLHMLPMLFVLSLSVAAPALGDAEEDVFYPTAFAPVFREGAVLQRECDLPVWGTAKPGSAVAVFLDSAIAQTTADETGNWRVLFPPQDPGTDHHLALVVNGRPATVVENVAFGDVWFCAGDDEMALSFFSNVENAEKELADTDYPNLRIFNVPLDLSIGPQTSVGGNWISSEFNSARATSALAYLFGRRIHKELDVPVGIIRAVKERTPAVAWLPLDAAAEIEPEKAEARGKALRAWAAGGEASFDRAVAEWEASYDGDDPYENADILPSDTDFEENASWVATEVPTTIEKALDSPDFDGVAWFRRTVFLTAAQAEKKATLFLGVLDDEDTTWVNGEQVGAMKHALRKRLYEIPENLLHAGSNLIAVRVRDTGGKGGFTEEKDSPAIRFEDGTSVDLSEGLWSCRAKKAPKGPRPTKTLLADDAVGICFDSFVSPFAGMAVRGMVWAGGGADVAKPEGYGKAMESLVSSWRGAFAAAGKGDIPFFLLQSASHGNKHPEPVESSWAAIRNAQMGLTDKLPGVFVAVSIDDGNPWGPISHRKGMEADRLSDIALTEVYGWDRIVSGSPRAVAATAKDGKVILDFSPTNPLRTSDEKPIRGFQLAAPEGGFAWAAAEVVDGGVALDIPEGMKAPAKVRYAWDDYPDCNLVGVNGHPVGSFELAIGE